MSETQTNQTTEQTNDQTPPTEERTFQDLLGSITNEQGDQKYHTIEDALKGSAHAQKYILELKQSMASMENEKRELEQELARRKGFEEVLDTISSKSKEEATTSTETEQVDFEALIERKLAERETKVVTKRNQEEVYTKLAETYGSVEAGVKAFKDKADELGLSVQDLQALSAKAPKAVLSYFGKPQAKVNLDNSVNGDAIPPKAQPPEVKTNIMGGASREEVLALWRSCKPNQE